MSTNYTITYDYNVIQYKHIVTVNYKYKCMYVCIFVYLFAYKMIIEVKLVHTYVHNLHACMHITLRAQVTRKTEEKDNI